MGAWGIGAFEDDSALDWFETFEERGAPAVMAALDAVLAVPEGAEIDADIANEGRAAAEVVAAVFGRPAPELEADRRARMLTVGGDLRRDPSLPAKALDVCGRIWSDASELHALWTEDDDTALEWREAGADMASRLMAVRAG
ncbi:MAG: DUF4259 domain-containing protein [Pikeienuella sp.]